MSNIQPTLSLNQESEATDEQHWWRKKQAVSTCHITLKPGNFCPSCGDGSLDYTGLFLLECDHCGKVAEGGAFT